MMQTGRPILLASGPGQEARLPELIDLPGCGRRTVIQDGEVVQLA